MLLLLLLLFLAQAASSLAADSNNVPSKVALRWVGYREVGKNRGYWVDEFNRKVGAPLGSPYCASFVYWVLDSVRWQPRFKTAWSRTYVRAGIPVWEVPDAGPEALLVWIRNGGGHIGFIVRSLGRYKWETVEANTSNGVSGSQWNGDGIYRRIREYEPFSVFRITHVVMLRHEKK
jgi:hypothetical protein